MKKKSLILGTTTLAITAGATLASAEVNQPQELNMRPLTTPAGQITVGGDFGFIMLPDPLDDGALLFVGGKYGVNEKLEVGALYGIALSPEFDAKGPLFAEGAFSIMDGNLSVAANAGFGYDLGGEQLLPLTAGARVRFRVDDKLSITSGGGSGDPITSFIVPGHLNGHQLSIALDAEEGQPKPVTLSLPIGVSYQVSPQIHAYVNTSIGTLSISDSDSVFFGADLIPLTVGGFFSPSNTMDFGASVGWFDLKDNSDVLSIYASARLHM